MRTIKTTRRELLKAAMAMTIAALCPPSRADSSVDEQRGRINELVAAFVEAQHIPALPLAFARPNQLLLVKEWDGAAATPGNLFRIARVTKPITAVAIFKLIERDTLKLDDKIFGIGSLLDGDFGTDLPAIESKCANSGKFGSTAPPVGNSNHAAKSETIL